jgi:hypothetical protein
MKAIARVLFTALLAAGTVGLYSQAALAAKGQDFPNDTCTCKGCEKGGDLTGNCASVCKDKTVYSKGSEPHDYCKATRVGVGGGRYWQTPPLGGIKYFEGGSKPTRPGHISSQ